MLFSFHAELNHSEDNHRNVGRILVVLNEELVWKLKQKKENL